ncbi:MAG: DUF1801 domain-containing protein [Bacteroidota bacterium]
MGKMQPVDFDSVEEFLDYLPPSERTVVDRLREIILSTIPEIQENLAYQVPFYRRRPRICFIGPGSVPWGNVPPDGVQSGFVRGDELQDDRGWLEAAHRKHVRTRTSCVPTCTPR